MTAEQAGLFLPTTGHDAPRWRNAEGKTLDELLREPDPALVREPILDDYLLWVCSTATATERLRVLHLAQAARLAGEMIRDEACGRTMTLAEFIEPHFASAERRVRAHNLEEVASDPSQALGPHLSAHSPRQLRAATDTEIDQWRELTFGRLQAVHS